MTLPAGFDEEAIGNPASPLETVSRPLLRLVQHITGMETSFVTRIDWDAQQQDVLFSLNTGALQIAEQVTTDWKDSMCRSMFLAGQAASQDVGGDVVATCSAVDAGLRSFVAVPILTGDAAIGTVCGASREQIHLRDDQVDALRHIADALQQLLQVEREKNLAQERALRAEHEARLARDAACQQAIDYHQMQRLAHTDELTRLPNRRAFVARWEDALARSGRRHHGIGVLLIDVDRFKAINDTAGHLVGDEVLGALGATLRQTMQTQDMVARLGGDEFVMGVSHASRDELIATARSIRERFAAAVRLIGVDVTLSIGIAHSDDTSRHRLLADADLAMYRSKAGGGDCETAFTGDAVAGQRLGLEKRAEGMKPA